MKRSELNGNLDEDHQIVGDVNGVQQEGHDKGGGTMMPYEVKGMTI